MEGPEFLLTRLRDPNEEGGTLCSATGGRKFSDELLTALEKRRGVLTNTAAQGCSVDYRVLEMYVDGM